MLWWDWNARLRLALLTAMFVVAATLASASPQIEGTRSLNIAVAAGIGLAEALRQTGGWAT
jgi:tRNA(Leu) C34 or U34 (ribose-2'-O)-methylase TrmL